MRIMANRSYLAKVAAAPKRATNVSLSEALVAEAKEYGISVSRSCEAGLAAAVKQAREERWLEQNRAALESNHEWVEKHGLPLERYRLF